MNALAAMDRLIMYACKDAGLDAFDALFYRKAHDPETDEPTSCTVTRDTLELANEYGVTVVESGANIGYLVADIANPMLDDYFDFDGKRYTVENKVPTQDSSLRFVHCRVGLIPEDPPEDPEAPPEDPIDD